MDMDLVKLAFGRTPWYPQIRNFQHLLEAIFAVVRYGYPARDLTVIGVTGTDGKTTTVHLIGEILRASGFKTLGVSTIGAFFDEETIDTGFHVTTPDARDVQKLLRQALERGVTHVVLETTSQGLDQHRVTGCNFKVGVLTNVTHEHLDYHKTWERYLAAKAKLFGGVKIAVLNKDDASFDYFKRAAQGARVITYSNRGPATLLAKNTKFDARGMKFDVYEAKKKVNLQTRIVGLYNVSNILAAAGVARGLGITWDKISGAIAKFPGVVGRMQEVKNNKELKIIVDFAHTPGAFDSLLGTLRKSCKGKLIAVFGSAGERDREKRPMMGQVATRYCDFMVLTTDDPRHEDPNKIVDDITRGIRQDARVWDGQADWRSGGKWVIRVLDRGEAIALAIGKLARRGDIVALLGQGNVGSMPIGDKEVPWLDAEAGKVALAGGVRKME